MQYLGGWDAGATRHLRARAYVPNVAALPGCLGLAMERSEGHRSGGLVAYFLLAFLISWGAVFAIQGPSGLPAPAEDAQALGMGLLLGPFSAMVFLTGRLRGRKGFRELFLDLGRVRVRVRFYAFALLTGPASALIALLGLSLFDGGYAPRFLTSDSPGPLVASGLGAGLFIAFFEELGWTGFAAPRLLQTRGPLRAGVVLGTLWGLWHLPPFWQADSFSSPLPLALLAARLLTWIVAFRVLMVWLYSRTRSLPVVILMHTNLVLCMVAIEPPLHGAALITYTLTWSAVLWLTAALVLRRQRRGSQAVEPGATLTPLERGNRSS